MMARYFLEEYLKFTSGVLLIQMIDWYNLKIYIDKYEM